MPPTFYMVPHKVRRNANLLAHQREGPFPVCRNATVTTPFPTNHRGPSSECRNAIMLSPPPVYKVPNCTRRNATKGAHSREGSLGQRKNAKDRTPFPTNHRGSCLQRRNAIDPSPPPNLGHAVLAEMPSDCRPNNTDQRPIEKR
jgi:hypothetical protein